MPGGISALVTRSGALRHHGAHLALHAAPAGTASLVGRRRSLKHIHHTKGTPQAHGQQKCPDKAPDHDFASITHPNAITTGAQALPRSAADAPSGTILITPGSSVPEWNAGCVPVISLPRSAFEMRNLSSEKSIQDLHGLPERDNRQPARAGDNRGLWFADRPNGKQLQRCI